MGDEKRTCRRCGVVIPAGMLACRYHWYQLPRQLREWILATYRAGDHKAYVEYVRKADQIWKEDNDDPRAAAAKVPGSSSAA